MFISDAFAQTAATATQAHSPEWLSILVQLGLIFFVFYFLLLRPQQKKFKEHERSLNSIQKGSKVIVGGLLGVVQAVENDKLKIEVSKGVEVTVFKAYVSQVLDENNKKD